MPAALTQEQGLLATRPKTFRQILAGFKRFQCPNMPQSRDNRADRITAAAPRTQERVVAPRHFAMRVAATAFGCPSVKRYALDWFR